MQAWFQQLAPRERLFVSIAAALVLLLLVVTLGVRPIVSNTIQGQKRVVDRMDLLSEIERVAARIGPQSGSAPSARGVGNQSLVVVIDRTTRETGLAPYLKRNQPDGATSIRLRFENAPFDALVEWLGDVKSQQGLVVTSASIDKTAQTGRINSNLTLSRGGG